MTKDEAKSEVLSKKCDAFNKWFAIWHPLERSLHWRNVLFNAFTSGYDAALSATASKPEAQTWQDRDKATSDEFAFSMAKQLAALFLTGPNGEQLVISSALEQDARGTFRFAMIDPKTGKRWGVFAGITELRKHSAWDRYEVMEEMISEANGKKGATT